MRPDHHARCHDCHAGCHQAFCTFNFDDADAAGTDLVDVLEIAERRDEDVVLGRDLENRLTGLDRKSTRLNSSHH